jgi:hypothetical protein
MYIQLVSTAPTNITATTSTYEKPVLAFTFDKEPNQEVKDSIERLFGGVLCSFPEETLKTSPTLVIYCIILAILWIFLVITLCFGYIRQIIDRISRLFTRNGFQNNRENTMVNEEGSFNLQGLLSLGSTAHNQPVSICNNNK